MKDNHHPFYATYVYCIYVCICHLGIHDYIYICPKRVLLFIPTQSIVGDGIKTRWSRAGINSTVWFNPLVIQRSELENHHLIGKSS